jgi:hypothetical protein
MLGPFFFVCPLTYMTLKAAAAWRHEFFGPVLGTHARDSAMRFVYPI